MKFAVNGLAFLRFMDSGGEPSGDADEGRLGGREGGGEPGAGGIASDGGALAMALPVDEVLSLVVSKKSCCLWRRPCKIDTII